ncbi:MAG: hypothetical protein AABX86_03065, partial [Nanoarchaeota archaeon]
MAKKTPDAPSSQPDLASKLPELPDAVKQRFEEVKKKLETFKDKTLEKFDKYILGISLLPPEKQPFEGPPPAAATPPPGPEQKSDELNILVLINDSDSEKMSKFELREKMFTILDKIAADIDKSFKPEVMLLTELRESLYDAKYEILRLIGM